MSDIAIEKINEVFFKIYCEPAIAYELNDYFSFFVPGYQFQPKYRAKVWDGKIRLFHLLSQTLYAGLYRHVEKFAKDRDYTVEYLNPTEIETIDREDAEKFVATLKSSYVPREYQYDAFITAVNNERLLLLSPTASGKSFIIYLLLRYYAKRTLIIVPTTTLVGQLADDFRDYGFDSDRFIHKIYSGKDKNTDKPVVITTWQSIYKLPKDWFDKFSVVIGDEAHGFKAKSLTSIMTKLENCKYRFGTTGTLDGTETNRLVLEGLFGPVYSVISTKELMNQGHISKLNIKALVLNYKQETRKFLNGSNYQDEISFLIGCEPRNNFIRNLALSMKGNTLVLFHRVEQHGKILHKIIKEAAAEGRNIYYVSGEVETEIREQIRKIVNTEKDAIVVASMLTFSTGINIPNLHNVIFASPSKARIKILQSIGRALRKAVEKHVADLYDIADDLTFKSWTNYTLNHFMERVTIYNSEQLDYKIYKIPVDA